MPCTSPVKGAPAAVTLNASTTTAFFSARTSGSKRATCQNPSDSIVMLVWYRQSGDAAPAVTDAPQEKVPGGEFWWDDSSATIYWAAMANGTATAAPQEWI